MLIKTSKNYIRSCFALKCDIRKFFDSVDHPILLNIIKKRVKDQKAIWLLNEIIESYSIAVSPRERRKRSVERFTDWQFNFPAFCQYISE